MDTVEPGRRGRPRRVHCRQCERHVDECGPLSSRGKCEACGMANMVANNVQMAAGYGPWWDAYRERMREVLRLD